MKIFLISPPSNCDDSLPWLEPLGLSYIASVCRNAGHEVEIRDLLSVHTADTAGLFAELDAFEPDLVGLTAMTENFKNGREIARAVKSRYGCITVFGGWHVSGEPTVVRDPAIDFLVKGEGEETMLELLDYVQGRGPSLENIEGLVWLDGDEVRVNPPRKRIRKLAELPRPMREGLPIEDYKFPMLFCEPVTRMRTLSVQASRGCPYTCTFCQTPAIWSNVWSKRTPVDVVDEIEELVARYKFNTLIFRDEEFTVRKNWVMEICDEMASRDLPKKFKWGSFARVDDVTPELVEAMHRGGSRYVFMGVEATSDEQQEKIKKWYKREQAEQAFATFRNAGVTTHGSWIIGFPWDTRAQLDSAFEWVRTLPMDFLSVLYATPFGSTPLREEVEREGLLLTDDPNYFNVNEPAIEVPGIPLEELRGLASHYRNRYFFNPGYMAGVAWQCLKSPTRARIVSELFFGSLYRYWHRRRLAGHREQAWAVAPEFFEPHASYKDVLESMIRGDLPAAASGV